jgi:hypothetical protein
MAAKMKHLRLICRLFSARGQIRRRVRLGLRVEERRGEGGRPEEVGSGPASRSEAADALRFRRAPGEEGQSAGAGRSSLRRLLLGEGGNADSMVSVRRVVVQREAL